MMIIRSIVAGALALAFTSICAVAQTSQGSSPLSGAKGGTNNSFMQFTGPATSMKTFTLPNVSDTIVLLTQSQTLTNKTINCANNTCTPAAQGAYTFLGNNTGSSAVPTAIDIAGLTTKASPASGDYIMLSDQAASGAWKKASVSSVASAGSVSSIAGNTGAFTLSNGITNSTNDIRLATIAAGSVLGNNTTSTAIPSAVRTPVLLNTLTASSSATLSDTTSFTSTYGSYELVFDSLIPATDSVTAQFQVHSGGSFQSSNYVQRGYIPNGTAIVSQGSTTFVGLSNTTSQSNSGPGISGRLRIYSPSTSALHAIEGRVQYNFSGGAGPWTFGGYWNSSAVITGFQFLFSSGNITSGTIKVYGIP
jgi:hypothetical protein